MLVYFKSINCKITDPFLGTVSLLGFIFKDMILFMSNGTSCVGERQNAISFKKDNGGKKNFR